MIINVFYEKTDCRDNAFVSCFSIRMFFWILLSTTVSGFIRKKQMTNNCFWSCKKLSFFYSPIFYRLYLHCAQQNTFVLLPIRFSSHNP